MRANNKISDEVWTEIRTMFRGQITQDLRDTAKAIEKSMDNKAMMFTYFAKETGKREISEEEIRQLGIAVSVSTVRYHIPND